MTDIILLEGRKVASDKYIGYLILTITVLKNTQTHKKLDRKITLMAVMR